jgi:hypothetical protein
VVAPLKYGMPPDVPVANVANGPNATPLVLVQVMAALPAENAAEQSPVTGATAPMLEPLPIRMLLAVSGTPAPNQAFTHAVLAMRSLLSPTGASGAISACGEMPYETEFLRERRRA